MRPIIYYARIAISEILNYSTDYKEQRVLSSIIRDLREIEENGLVAQAMVIDSDSFAYLCDTKESYYIVRNGRFFWRGLPIYIDHLAGFRADVIGEPAYEDVEPAARLNILEMIKQGKSKKEICDLVEECFILDLFA